MNQWSSRRKTVIFLILFVVAIVAVGVPLYYSLQQKPDCQNQKQDGDETGVDCGGSCQLLCKPETLPILTKGDARLLNIASTTYEAVILVENPNINGTVVRAPYTFNIYHGTERKPIKTIVGSSYVGRNSTFAIFEGPFSLDGTGPFRAVFAWDKNLKWEKSADISPTISVDNTNLALSSTSVPRLEARLNNRSNTDASNIEVVALLSDVDGNLVGAAKTFVNTLDALTSTPLVFSWSQAFSAPAVSIRVLPHILPDKSYINSR